MKKFLHVIYIIVMRILIFTLFLMLLPMWILIGLIVTFSILFGQADDFFAPRDDGSAENCPEKIETENYESVDKES